MVYLTCENVLVTIFDYPESEMVRGFRSWRSAQDLMRILKLKVDGKDDLPRGDGRSSRNVIF